MTTSVPVKQLTATSRMFTRIFTAEAIKAAYMAGLGQYSIEKLPTDSVGTTVLTLTNVVVGSRYRVEVASTGALAEPTANATGVAAAPTIDISLSRYAVGNANNDLRIKVRKASSAPLYQPYETQASLSGDALSVYIAQQED